jgi:multiple sugar transport system permease protein
MYNPETGPINAALRPVLGVVGEAVRATPGWGMSVLGWALLGVMVLLAGWALGRLRRWWIDGECGTAAVLLGAVFVVLPAGLMWSWSGFAAKAWPMSAVVGALAVAWLFVALREGKQFEASSGEAMGTALVLGLAVLVGQMILMGLAAMVWHLPTLAAADGGIAPPQWIHSYHWAKPSMMIIGFWAAVGSNNMLLYLAALTNIDESLYEAARIDGAGRLRQFWNITWPQLAPTTFFIAVMSTIGGLQGGFEMARTMTQGGPAGATTTLSYFVYLEGFEVGRLGAASAIAWILFILVFLITLFNWKFGNQYVED